MISLISIAGVDTEEKRVPIAGAMREVDCIFSTNALHRQGLVFFILADQGDGTFKTQTATVRQIAVVTGVYAC